MVNLCARESSVLSNVPNENSYFPQLSLEYADTTLVSFAR